jgi:hypothetical protein
MIVENGKHYLYRHIRLDKNEPFYIGVGTKREKKPNCFTCIYSRAFSKAKRTKFWKKIVEKSNYIVQIFLESDDYQFIELKEKEFIKLYGKKKDGKGTLCNIFDGGSSNFKSDKHLTIEHKLKLSSKNKGVKRTEESRIRMSNATKGKKKSLDHKEKIREIVTKQWKDGRKYSEKAVSLMIEKTSIPVKQIDDEGKEINCWKSISKMLKEMKISRCTFTRNAKNGNFKYKNLSFTYGK